MAPTSRSATPTLTRALKRKRSAAAPDAPTPTVRPLADKPLRSRSPSSAAGRWAAALDRDT
eukprot:12002762-Heterocapsa_arctica.AAC.1